MHNLVPPLCFVFGSLVGVFSALSSFSCRLVAVTRCWLRSHTVGLVERCYSLSKVLPRQGRCEGISPSAKASHHSWVRSHFEPSGHLIRDTGTSPWALTSNPSTRVHRSLCNNASMQACAAGRTWTSSCLRVHTRGARCPGVSRFLPIPAPARLRTKPYRQRSASSDRWNARALRAHLYALLRH